MTPNEFKEARQSLGLSQSQFAIAVQVQSDRTVRKWECGERDIPGPVIALLKIFKKHPETLKTAQNL